MSDETTAPLAEAQPMPRERSVYLDALRGYAIVLVVLGHAIQRGLDVANFFDRVQGVQVIPKAWWSVALLAFGYWHMPLFMALSGFLTFGHIKSPSSAWLNRKAALLLVPFLSWMLVYYWVPDRFLVKGSSLVGYVLFTILNPGNGLWYLPVLFVFYVLTVLVESTGTGEWGLLVVGIAIAAIPTSSLMAVDQMQIVWMWFALGYIVAKYRQNLFAWRWYIAAALVAAYPIALYELSHMHADEYLPLVKLGGVVGSCVLVFLLVRFMRLGKPLAFLGRRTLEIYVAQFLFTSLPILHGWGRVGAVAIIAVVGSLGVAWLMRKVPVLDVLFYGGRPRSTA